MQSKIDSKNEKKKLTELEKKKLRNIGPKMRLERRIEPFVKLGVSRKQAKRIAKGKLTVKQYFELIEEVERLSKICTNLSKEKIRGLLVGGENVEEYSDYLKRGAEYLKQCMEEKIPLVLRLYNKKKETGLIREVSRYEIKFGDSSEEEAKLIEKLNIKYCYKPEIETIVKDNLKINKAVKEKKLEPIRNRDDRCKIKYEFLRKTAKEKAAVKITLNEGEFFKGIIDWFDKFHISLSLTPESSILIFRHAIYDFKIIKEP